MLTSAKRNRRDHAILSVLVDTGCRKGEIATLGIEHVDLSSGVVRFPISKSGARSVPLSDRSISAELDDGMQASGDLDLLIHWVENTAHQAG